jgi:hypothetical protein
MFLLTSYSEDYSMTGPRVIRETIKLNQVCGIPYLRKLSIAIYVFWS